MEKCQNFAEFAEIVAGTRTSRLNVSKHIHTGGYRDTAQKEDIVKNS